MTSGALTIDGNALREMSGKGVRIAVIDSGIAPSHPHVGAVSTGVALVGDDASDTADRMGHGTAVAAAIRDLAPDTELIPVRVLDRELATSARILSRAIHWAVEARVHIVNLSLGTSNEAHIPLFRDALHEARAHGVCVISAANHSGTPWYPGALPNALGVVASTAIPRHGLRIVRNAAGAVIETSPLPRPIEGVPVERNLSGVSFAVANATGIVARAIEAGAPRASVDELLKWLEGTGEKTPQ